LLSERTKNGANVPPAAIVPFRRLRRVKASFAEMIMALNAAD
jgi:hypothetical protein